MFEKAVKALDVRTRPRARPAGWLIDGYADHQAAERANLRALCEARAQDRQTFEPSTTSRPPQPGTCSTRSGTPPGARHPPRRGRALLHGRGPGRAGDSQAALKAPGRRSTPPGEPGPRRAGTLTECPRGRRIPGAGRTGAVTALAQRARPAVGGVRVETRQPRSWATRWSSSPAPCCGRSRSSKGAPSCAAEPWSARSCGWWTSRSGRAPRSSITACCASPWSRPVRASARSPTSAPTAASARRRASATSSSSRRRTSAPARRRST